jgi:hypothetical protein
LRWPHPPEEDFDVGPSLLARLAEKDAEQGVKIRKLYDLKQIMTIAAVCSGMSGIESRGLFVRPSQVIYAVDAAGADL